MNRGLQNYLADFCNVYFFFGHFFGFSREEVLYLTLNTWYLVGKGEPDKLMELVFFFIYSEEPLSFQLWLFALTLEKFPEYNQDPRLEQIKKFIFTFV